MSRLLSVSVPDELLDQVEALAREEGRTKSEFVRDTLRQRVLHGRLGAIQDDLQALAEAQGIGPEDVEDLIDELRAEERSRQS